MDLINWDDFTKIELRVGQVMQAQPFPEARKPAYILHIDFGEAIGILKSSTLIHASLLARVAGGTSRGDGGQFSTQVDRPLAVRMPGDWVLRCQRPVVLGTPDGKVPLGAKLL